MKGTSYLFTSKLVGGARKRQMPKPPSVVFKTRTTSPTSAPSNRKEACAFPNTRCVGFVMRCHFSSNLPTLMSYTDCTNHASNTSSTHWFASAYHPERSQEPVSSQASESAAIREVAARDVVQLT